MQVHTPIVTGLDSEGAGEMFRLVANADANANPSLHVIDSSGVDGDDGDDSDDNGGEPESKSKSSSGEFFGRRAYLTVSGQLPLEACCCAMGDVYTFGPCFRAEASHTSRHLSEFWMVEPECAFAGLVSDE